jgi:serine/threonine protein kinase
MERLSIQREDLAFPEIKYEEVQLLEELGHGACGKVYKGMCRGKIVAIKELDGLSANNIENFKSEVIIMTQLRHPNILLFMGACLSPGLIVMEYLPNGDLEKLLLSKKELSLLDILHLGKDMAMGMNWLHLSTPIIIHKDLKPANVLLDQNGTAKIADFGLSVKLETKKVKSKAFEGSVYIIFRKDIRGILDGS